MIYLGLSSTQKLEVVEQYCLNNSIQRIVVLTPPKFSVNLNIPIPHEHVFWGESGIGVKNELVQYKFYYRLIQEIDHSTLLVINECLRTQNRHDLTYNCIRQFLQQTHHQLIFQYLPFIDGIEDFMILFDFDTRSTWKRELFSSDLVANAQTFISPVIPQFKELKVETSAKVKAAYEKKKIELIDGIGQKDPHTIPRNLYLTTGRSKLPLVEPSQHYIGRNNRFKLPNLVTYRDPDGFPDRYTVFEFCHNHIEFNDFLALSRQVHIPVITTDLKVDQWYLQRYHEWVIRLEDAISQIPHTLYGSQSIGKEEINGGSIGQQDENGVGSSQRAYQLSLRLL